MPKGHEDFVVASRTWPKPEEHGQSKDLASESEHLEQSSTASETVETGSKNPYAFGSC
jgi:hypothetical protein